MLAQTNFWRTLVGIGERLLRTTLHTELLDLLHGMEEEVSLIRADAELRGSAAKDAHGAVTKALEASVRLGESDKRRVAELEEEKQALEERASSAEAECKRFKGQIEEMRSVQAAKDKQMAVLEIQLGKSKADLEKEKAVSDTQARPTCPPSPCNTLPHAPPFCAPCSARL